MPDTSLYFMRLADAKTICINADQTPEREYPRNLLFR